MKKCTMIICAALALTIVISSGPLALLQGDSKSLPSGFWSEDQMKTAIGGKKPLSEAEVNKLLPGGPEAKFRSGEPGQQIDLVGTWVCMYMGLMGTWVPCSEPTLEFDTNGTYKSFGGNVTGPMGAGLFGNGKWFLKNNALTLERTFGDMTGMGGAPMPGMPGMQMPGGMQMPISRATYRVQLLEDGSLLITDLHQALGYVFRKV